VAGHTESWGAGKFDGWLIRFEDPTLASVSPDQTQETGLLLSAPVPNPAASAVVFSMHMPRTGMIDLRVVNVEGRIVRTLQSGTLSAGRHDFEWNLANEQGARVASGVYFIVADGVVKDTRRAVVVR